MAIQDIYIREKSLRSMSGLTEMRTMIRGLEQLMPQVAVRGCIGLM